MLDAYGVPTDPAASAFLEGVSDAGITAHPDREPATRETLLDVIRERQEGLRSHE
jgi:hypothetical protein